MIATLIGLVSSLVTILIFTFLKRIDKNTIYGLILMAIGFLYIGYTWTDFETAILSFMQAMFFMVLAYLGIKRNYWFLVAGYFLHGIWDMIYPLVANPDLLPPDYDYFCLTYDFIVGFYLMILNYRVKKS
ncbi:MAG: hypothetical protein IPN60_20630 [Saprospiraceae bacterium]|nr:hypothetical protein [Candidatus Opimibacter skivensis]